MLTRLSDWNGWPSFGLGRVPRGFGAFDQLRQEMDRLLFDFERTVPEGTRTFSQVRFEDSGPAFLIRAEVPGLSEKDLEISATATTLSLRGERKVEAPQGYGVHRSERGSFKFSRTFELPSKIDAEKVDASLVNGILTVTLPKAPEARPKQIAVKAS